jgi:micrococcal nuclease
LSKANASASGYSTFDALEQKQPDGHRSRQSLIALCGGGAAAQVDGSRQDRNGRVLAHVRYNGLDAGAEQVAPLYAVEAETRAARRGLWATLQPVPPWEWRSQ